jgi:hypothetical protein
MISRISKVITFSIFMVLSMNLMSQDFNKFTDKLYWGGNFGLSFGTYTYIQIAPVVSYAVNDNFYVGTGMDYTYFKDSRNSFLNTYEGSIWAPKVFARYFVGDFFGHVEFQQIYYKNVYNIVNPNEMVSESHYYAGGGYRSWVGNNSFMFVMLLFDLERSDFYFGDNPLIQIGFSSGF